MQPTSRGRHTVERHGASPAPGKSGSAAWPATAPHDRSVDILALQATAGNRAVGRLLAAPRPAREPPPATPLPRRPRGDGAALARTVADRRAREHPVWSASPSIATAGLQRSAEEPGWMETATKFWGGVKESAYSWMIEKLRGAQSAGLRQLRGLAQGLPPIPAAAAEFVIGQVEILSDLLISLLLAVIGLAVGLVSGLAKLLWGLLSFLVGILKTLILFIAGFFDQQYRDQFDEQMNAVGRAIKNLMPALRTLKDRWIAEFEAANPDRKTLMIGELTGEIEALLVSIWMGGQAASAIPKVTVTVPVRAFAVLGAGGGGGVAVTFAAGGPVAAGGLTAAMASSIDDAAKSGGKDKAPKDATPAKDPVKDLELDPQTGTANPKSRAEAETIRQAQAEGIVKDARRPDLAKGEPNLDFVIDGGYAEVKTPDTAFRTLAQNVDDIAQKVPVYDPDVRVIIDLKKLSAADRATFATELAKALSGKRANYVLLNP